MNEMEFWAEVESLFVAAMVEYAGFECAWYWGRCELCDEGAYALFP